MPYRVTSANIFLVLRSKHGKVPQKKDNNIELFSDFPDVLIEWKLFKLFYELN